VARTVRWGIISTARIAQRAVIPAIQDSHNGTIIVRRDDETQTITVPGANHYQLMVEHFAECVLTGREPCYPPSEGRDNMCVLDALYESARSGRLVRLDAP
jgi:predicted dehydrogenase